MSELDIELWRLGIPAKTRHNEVCPAQFEIAPVYEDLNLAVDHNMLTMNILEEVAARHGFACLLHEKPYEKVNGSGKHNNWNIVGPDGKNWLKPGDTPHDNAKFLFMLCAIIKAVDTHAPLLRASVSSAGNDHRLGANEAPPAIISIFLGDQLNDIIEQIGRGAATSSRSGGTIEIGVSSLPELPRDATDRNRTSPFAFTGNKFEFRAVGSSQSCATPNVVLNTITAWALDEMCTAMEKSLEEGKDFNAVLQDLLSETVRKHDRVLFNGDNYSEAWHEEAEKRGLPNLRTTPEALKYYIKPESIAMFEKYQVFSARELGSRYNVYQEQYNAKILIEAQCSLEIAKTIITPAVTLYQQQLAETVNSLKKAGIDNIDANMKLLKKVTDNFVKMQNEIANLEKAVKSDDIAKMLTVMTDLRLYVDELEGLVDYTLWPLVPYSSLMFIKS